MTTVREIFEFLNTFCPVDTQCSWDNSGIVLGDASAPVHRVLLSLDVTSAVIDEAERFDSELIISHHPVIWETTRRLLASDPDHRNTSVSSKMIFP